MQALVGDDGDVTLTWIDGDRSTHALRRINATWGAPVALSGAPDSALAWVRRAVIDGDGHVTVLFFGATVPRQIELRRIARGSSPGAPRSASRPSARR